MPITLLLSPIAVKDANNVYLGESEGGVWKTSDRGTTWNPLADNLLVSYLPTGALTIDPTNSSTLYAGLGEQDFGDDRGGDGQDGVLKPDVSTTFATKFRMICYRNPPVSFVYRSCQNCGVT